MHYTVLTHKSSFYQSSYSWPSLPILPPRNFPYGTH